MKLFLRLKRILKPKPLVTIITPTFNAEGTLERTILSVLEQSYKNIEFLIIDGLSNDGSADIIRMAAKKDRRIRYIIEKDSGAYDAMNKGLSITKGNWVYFLGADDILIHNGILEELYNEGLFSQDKVFYGNVIIEGDTSWAKDQEIYAGEFDLAALLKRNICHQAIFYPEHVIRKAGFFNQHYLVCADWDYNLRCFAMQPFLFVDKIIARFSGGGLSTLKEEKIFFKEFAGNILRYFTLDPDDPKLKEEDSAFRSIILSYDKLRQHD